MDTSIEWTVRGQAGVPDVKRMGRDPEGEK
jgi:hypothetical protein